MMAVNTSTVKCEDYMDRLPSLSIIVKTLRLTRLNIHAGTILSDLGGVQAAMILQTLDQQISIGRFIPHISSDGFDA